MGFESPAAHKIKAMIEIKGYSVRVWCDGEKAIPLDFYNCNQHEKDFFADTFKLCIEEAKSNDWLINGKKHYCPHCRTKL